MLEDETEVLDWGNDEEDHDIADTSLPAEDAEDAVSLGGDEDDEFLTYQSHGNNQRTPSTTSDELEKGQIIVAGADVQGKAPDHDRPRTPAKAPHEPQTVPEPSPALHRQLSFGKLTHALPPKPIVSSVPFVHPSHPSIIEATAMAARIDRDKKNGNVPKSTTYESGDALPPDWEVRHPRNGRGVYYYNSRTKESTWTRPGSSMPSNDRLDTRVADDTRDMAVINKTGDSLTSRIGRSDADSIMSYDDRHYRPGESARREERPPVQSYGSQHDSFLASNRANGERSLSSPPRRRVDDRAPVSRRQQSPSANADWNRGRPSNKDTARPSSPIAATDRVWVAPSDLSSIDRSVPHEGKHREAEAPHKERERCEVPRDADRMSATRPRPNSRFSQAPSTQIDQRIPDSTSRDLHTHDRPLSRESNQPRFRTSNRHQVIARAHESPDIGPQTLPHFRKRMPLPPQRTSFHEGSRSTTSLRYREDRDGSAPKRPRAMMDDAETPMLKPPPSAPMPKLSGTNSMPIGSRSNRFGSSTSISPHRPLPSVPLPPPVISAPRRAMHVSGSNAQPVVSRPVRPPAVVKESYERPPHLDAAYETLADQRRQGAHEGSPLLQRKPLSMPDPHAHVPDNNALPPRSGGRASRTRFGPPVDPVEQKFNRPIRRSLGEFGPRTPVDSRADQPFEDIPFQGDRLDQPSSYRGSSLIERLAVEGGEPPFSSLRDRVKVPMKRRQEDVFMNEEGAMDIDDGMEAFKRNRRRGGKPRKPRRVT